MENIVLIAGAPLLMFPPMTEGFNLFSIIEENLKLRKFDGNDDEDENKNSNKNSDKKETELEKLLQEYNDFKDWEFNFYNWVQHSEIELLNLHFNRFNKYYQLAKETYFDNLLENGTITQDDLSNIKENCWNRLTNNQNNNNNNNNKNNVRASVDDSTYIEGGYMTAAIYFDMGLWHNWKKKLGTIFLQNEESKFDANVLIVHPKYDLQKENATYDYASIFLASQASMIEIDHVSADHMIVYYDVNTCQSSHELVHQLQLFWKQNQATELTKNLKETKEKRKRKNVCQDGSDECFEQL